MKIDQVVAQGFTIRNHCKTSADIAESMKKIRRIGYRAVQVSAFGQIPEEELAKILDGEGVVCAATHEGADKILDTPQQVVERLQKLNCKYTAVPSPGGRLDGTIESVRTYISEMDKAGAVLREAGQVLTYHNHHIEFQKFEGKILLDMIYDGTDPRNLQGEPDTYWIQYGGGCPVTWCRKLKGRLPLLHMKDYGVNENKEVKIKEIGRGNLDWKPIVAAAEESGCEWFFVEQDNNWTNDDPFESLKISFEYIRDNLCS